MQLSAMPHSNFASETSAFAWDRSAKKQRQTLVPCRRNFRGGWRIEERLHGCHHKPLRICGSYAAVNNTALTKVLSAMQIPNAGASAIVRASPCYASSAVFKPRAHSRRVRVPGFWHVQPQLFIWLECVVPILCRDRRSGNGCVLNSEWSSSWG